MGDTMTDKASYRLNWSSLKHMHVSPLEYQWRINHPEPDKPSYILGRACHCAILEPDKMTERFALCDVRRNKRDKAFQSWLAEHPDAEPLNAEEMRIVDGVTSSVLGHRVAAAVLTGCRTEETLEWQDPDTGFLCRGRIDAIGLTVTDLKTGRDPSPRAFARAAAQYLYHGQLAFYHFGAVALKKVDAGEMPYIIAVATEPPFDVAVYRMKPEDLEAGRDLCLSLMRRLDECIAADMWPGCAPDLQYLDLPPWAAGLQDQNQEEW